MGKVIEMCYAPNWVKSKPKVLPKEALMKLEEVENADENSGKSIKAVTLEDPQTKANVWFIFRKLEDYSKFTLEKVADAIPVYKAIDNLCDSITDILTNPTN